MLKPDDRIGSIHMWINIDNVQGLVQFVAGQIIVYIEDNTLIELLYLV